MNKLALCYRVLSQNARKEDNSLRCKNSLQILVDSLFPPSNVKMNPLPVVSFNMPSQNEFSSIAIPILACAPIGRNIHVLLVLQSNLHKLQNAVVSLRNEWMKEVNDLQNRVKDVRVSQVNKSFALQAIDERCKLLLGPMSILEKQIENLTGEIQRHIDTRKRVEAARSSRSAGQSNPRQQQQNVPQQQLGQREQRQQPRQLLRSSTSISQHPPQFQTQAEIGGTTSIDPQVCCSMLLSLLRIFRAFPSL